MRGGMRQLWSRSPVAVAAIVGMVGLGIAAVPARAALTLRPSLTGVARRGGKLSPRLSALEGGPSFASARATPQALSLPPSGPGSLVHEPGGRVLVEIQTSDTGASGIAKLRALGADVVNVSPTYHAVTAAVLPSALGAIAGDAAVTYVSEVLAPLTAAIGRRAASGTLKPRAGGCTPTISEGNTLMNVAAARAQNEVDGTGQTIGVLSDSFNTDTTAPTHAAADIATGDLPGPGNPCGYTTPVNVQADYSGGGQADEGRAMLELAHGLAPAANLAFATAANGELDFANQVTQLRTVNHATAIVDDSQYLDEPFFQDGPVAQAANAASAAGVPFFSAAGNANTIVGGNNVSSYETPSFRSTPCPASVLALEPLTGCHNFDPNGGTDNTDNITLAPGGGLGIDLQWAQAWGAVSNDYDVFLLDATGTTVLAGSALDQGSFHEPFEFFGYTNNTASPQTVQLVIAKFSPAGGDSRMKFVMVGSSGITGVQYDQSAGGDVVGPTIFGHNGAASVGSTAAIPYDNSNTPEDYSSRGPVTQYFQPTPSTAALGSPVVLQKPDFAATDNVRNVFFAELGVGGYRFAGTSAAAPQAAAIGALLREYDPALSPAQIMSTLRSTARSVATNGDETDVGGGYLDALAALASVAPPPRATQVLSETNGNGSVTLHWSAARAGLTYPVTSYQVTPIRNAVPQSPRTFNSGATTQVVSGLTNGAMYQFTVSANNANGPGPVSAPSAAIIVAQPGKPRAVSAVPGNASATVTWTKPTVTFGHPIRSYELWVFANGKFAAHLIYKTPATKQVVTGLTNGKKYTFQVTAQTTVAAGPFSDPSIAIVVGAPGAPTGVTATAAHKSAKIHWKAPANNGKPITSYTVTPYIGTVAKGARVFRSAATTQTFTGLTTGQHYTFRVAATNARGTGPRSAASNAVKVT